MLLHKQQPVLMELQEAIAPAAPKWGPATFCSNSLSFQPGPAWAEARGSLRHILSTPRFVCYINSGAGIDLSVSKRAARQLSCWMRNGSLRGVLALWEAEPPSVAPNEDHSKCSLHRRRLALGPAQALSIQSLLLVPTALAELPRLGGFPSTEVEA